MQSHQNLRNRNGYKARRLRIAWATAAYWPNPSGTEVYSRGVCDELVRRGHDVRVICGQSRGAPFVGEDEVLNGVGVWRGIGTRRTVRRVVMSRVSRLRSACDGALAKPVALEYEARLRAANPDVVVALPVPRQSIVGAARFAKRTGCPALAVPFYHLSYKDSGDDAARWLGLLNAFTAVAATTAVESAFLESGGVASERLRRPGMFVRPLARPPFEALRAYREHLGVGSGFLVVSASVGLSEPKGLLLLLRAAAAMPHVTFAFLGGTPRRQSPIEANVRSGSNVHFLGFVSEHEKALALAAADLFALPSRAESFGIIYQEAHSLGTPSLSLDLPVMREVIGPAGFHVDPVEGECGVGRAIADLARRPDILKQASVAAPSVAARYAPERILPAIGDLIEEVSEQRSESNSIRRGDVCR